MKDKSQTAQKQSKTEENRIVSLKSRNKDINKKITFNL